jgi:GR25 family glycosyltransferase involved in LPS biosynthesis
MPKLNDLFDRIVIINLPERADRRREMANELARVQLSLNSDGVVLFPAIRPQAIGDFPSIGARGAYLSHLEVLRNARNANIQHLLVLEDDLMIDPKLGQTLESLSVQINTNAWDFFYLGHMGKGSLPAHIEPTQAPQQCLHFYAVQRRVMDDLIAYLEACLQRPAGHPEGGSMHVDGAISMFRQRYPQYKTWLLMPSMGKQRPSRSDITDNKWYDRSPIISPVMKLARSMKQVIARLK